MNATNCINDVLYGRWDEIFRDSQLSPLGLKLLSCKPGVLGLHYSYKVQDGIYMCLVAFCTFERPPVGYGITHIVSAIFAKKIMCQEKSLEISISTDKCELFPKVVNKNPFNFCIKDVKTPLWAYM